MKSAPLMAMIDTPTGERYYFIAPVPPGIYSPAICLIRGVLRQCYVIPGRLGIGSVYSEGSERVWKRHVELKGIHAALQIMTKLWEGVLKFHPGACDDLPQQERLAKSLTGPPEAAFALIEKSGTLGTDGMPSKASNLYRNVMALAHWKVIWSIRKCRRESDPGGLAWNAAATMMNRICHEAFPDRKDRQWEDFTASTLKSLADRYCLDPAVMR